MKRFSRVVVVLILSSLGHAQHLANLFSPSDLQRYCAAWTRTQWAAQNDNYQYLLTTDWQGSAFCSGYIAGVIDGTNGMTWLDEGVHQWQVIRYVVPNMKVGDFVKLVVGFMESHPEQMSHATDMSLVIMKALQEAHVMVPEDENQLVINSFKPPTPSDSRNPRQFTLPGGAQVIENQ